MLRGPESCLLFVAILQPLLACGVGTSHYAVLTDTSLDVYDGCYGTIVASSSLHTSVTTDTLLQVCCHGNIVIFVMVTMLCYY